MAEESRCTLDQACHHAESEASRFWQRLIASRNGARISLAARRTHTSQPVRWRGALELATNFCALYFTDWNHGHDGARGPCVDLRLSELLWETGPRNHQIHAGSLPRSSTSPPRSTASDPAVELPCCSCRTSPGKSLSPARLLFRPCKMIRVAGSPFLGKSGKTAMSPT